MLTTTLVTTQLSLSGKNKGLGHNNKDQEILNKSLSWMGDKQLPPRRVVWVTLVSQILQYKLAVIYGDISKPDITPK